MTFESAPNTPGQKPLNPLVKLALELGPLGIRANAVAPGVILTPRMKEHFSAEQVKAVGRKAPMGHLGDPSDIAGAALFLASPLASWVTGQTIVVDGGQLL